MTNDHLRAALYARVSGEQQEKEDTIASQLEAVTQRVASDGLDCEPELCFVDDGCSGYILTRPGLERLRDQAAAGVIDRLYVLDPDRFSRKYAYQVLRYSRNSPVAAWKSSFCAILRGMAPKRIYCFRSRA
jgi:site-specific DNA recombinase